MKIKIHVSTGAAIAAGHVEAGEIPVEITEAWLAGLTVAQRIMLSRILGADQAVYGSKVVYGYHAPIHAQASLEAIVEEIDAAIEQEAAKKVEEAKAAAEETAKVEKALTELRALPTWAVRDRSHMLQERYILTSSADRLRSRMTEADKVRLAREEVEVKRMNVLCVAKEDAAEAAKEAAKAKAEAARCSALDSWVAQFAGVSTQARYAEGLLPEHELLALIRDQVFAPLAEVERYEPLTKNDVSFDDENYAQRCSYSADAAESLSEQQYDALVEIRRQAKAIEGATVMPRRHEATGGIEPVARYGALVSLAWFGIPLSREYALPDAE